MKRQARRRASWATSSASSRLRNSQRARLKAASTWGSTSCSKRIRSSGSNSLKLHPAQMRFMMRNHLKHGFILCRGLLMKEKIEESISEFGINEMPRRSWTNEMHLNGTRGRRSEEHTSELQSSVHLV